MIGIEKDGLTGGTTPTSLVVRFQALLHMPQNPGNQCRLLDTGNHPQRAAAIGTGLDVNGEDALEALHLRHWLRM